MFVNVSFLARRKNFSLVFESLVVNLVRIIAFIVVNPSIGRFIFAIKLIGGGVFSLFHICQYIFIFYTF